MDPDDEEYRKRKKAGFIVNAVKSYHRMKPSNTGEEKGCDSRNNALAIIPWMEYATFIPNENVQQKVNEIGIEKMEVIISAILFKNQYKNEKDLFYKTKKEETIQDINDKDCFYTISLTKKRKRIP